MENVLERTVRIDYIRPHQFYRQLTIFFDEAISEKLTIVIKKRGSNTSVQISGKEVKLIMGSKVYLYSASEQKEALKNERSPFREIIMLATRNDPRIEIIKTAAITKFV